MTQDMILPRWKKGSGQFFSVELRIGILYIFSIRKHKWGGIEMNLSKSATVSYYITCALCSLLYGNKSHIEWRYVKNIYISIMMYTGRLFFLSSMEQIHPNLPLCLAILLGRYALFYMASFPSVGVPLWAFFKTLDAHWAFPTLFSLPQLYA